MTLQLDIRGCGNSFAIWQGTRVVAGPYTSNSNAIAALRGVEQRLDPTRVRYRKCSRCKEGFMASGRVCLCPGCRAGKG
jgi:hypothetical protein